MGKKLFAANGKRDIHGLELEYDTVVERMDSEKWLCGKNKIIVLEYLHACKKGQAKSGGRNLRVGKSTLYRVLGILRMLSETWLKKGFDDATLVDWQEFYDKMEEDKFLS